jgi:hypothetical protein
VSKNRIRLDGIEELRDALRRLPHDLKAEAVEIVQETAESAAAEIRAKYPTRTGNLREGVHVRPSEVSTFGAGAIVKNSAKHAWIFEHGTVARRTSIGAKRGSMPPGNVFIPIAIRKRRAMEAKLKAVLVRHGLVVSGG